MITLAIAAALTALSDCHAVLDGDRILGRHLASADAQFAGLLPDLFIGFAPSPGVKRVIPAEQLTRFLPPGSIDAQLVKPVCLEWPMRELAAAEFITAIREAFAAPDLRVEILDCSKNKVPPGQIRFDRKRIASEENLTGAGATWPGEVVAGGKRLASIWARVRIDHESEQIVAASDLRVGHILQTSDLRPATVRGLPSASPLPVEQMSGMTVLRPIRAGRPVVLSDLRPPLAVAKGDMLKVTVQRGSVLFRTEATAEAPGRAGDWIQVRNADSGKSFRALVHGPGQVQVP